MSGILGWGLAVIGIAMGYAIWGWSGVAMAVSVIVFWLLLQFSRVMRVMRTAGQSPVGTVPSAVMMQAKMKPGMRLMDIILLTRSLGEKRAEQPETWRWTDASGASVTVELAGGRCSAWRFERPGDEAAGPPAS
ncbi:hypothetical protein [Aquabacterium sp.]|uniref:hypothetical protein n=1 Tax=Aquabacterium sp. TaxID=1872578 RepID=UPI002CD195C5|nr:hypothetical protein [Aquabacterium sp.]HSW07080.1 hypothetical protein [Aquabacterium sp.]